MRVKFTFYVKFFTIHKDYQTSLIIRKRLPAKIVKIIFYMKHLFLLFSLFSLFVSAEAQINREERIKSSDDFKFNTDVQKEASLKSETIISSAKKFSAKATRAVDFSGGFLKNAVIEEATGMWCGYCPRGIVMCEHIRDHYSDRIFPIAVHQGDKMETDEYTDFLQDFVSSYPTAIVDRVEEIDISKEGADLLYEKIKDQLTYAKVNVTASLEGNVLMIESETEFAVDLDSEYRLAFVVVEDGVGPFFQTNYYTGADLGLGKWETEGNQVLCHFDDVARHIKNYNGIKGSLPDKIKAGERYHYSIAIELANVSSPVFKVIALIIDSQSKNIVNADRYSVETSEGLYLNKRELYLAVGEQEKLTAYLDGSPLDENSCVWSCSNEDVLRVDNNGNIEALAPGSAVIAVSCEAGKAQCQVYVEIIDSIFEIDGIRYKITGSNTCMVSFPKEGERYMMEKIVIPAEIEVLGRTFEVTELEFSMERFIGAFYDSPNLTEIELPNTITYLPGDVFERCYNLKMFKVPTSVGFIDAYAFNECRSLTQLNLNEGLTGIWTWCCAWCDNLKNIVLPSTLETMGREVFYGTHPYWINSKALVPPTLQGDLFHDEYLTDDYEECALVVPENCLEAYKNAEYWKKFEMIVPDNVILNRYKVKMNPGDEFKLDVVNSDGTAVTWFTSDSTIASVDADGKITAKSFGETTVKAECKGKMASCKVIVSYEGQTVQSEDLWFEIKENNTCAVIRNQSSELPYEMVKLNIPSEIVVSDQRIEVTEISYDAFNNCQSLTEITLPNSIKNILPGAFYQCTGLTEIIFNEGLEILGRYALAGCNSLESIVLPSTLKLVDPEVLAGDSPFRIVCKAFTPPVLENDLFDVSDVSTAYSECVLVVPANSVSAYKEAVYWNRFEIIVSDGLILNRYKLSLHPEEEYQLEVLNNDGMQVEWSSDSPKIVEVNTEGNITALSLGKAIIKAECNGTSAECLITVSMEGLCNQVDGLWYTIIDQNSCEVSAPKGEEYVDFDSIVLPSSVELFGCKYLLTSIGDYAFNNCYRLKQIDIPNSIVRIGTGSFSYCQTLNDVKLPPSLLSIGNDAFLGCPELTRIDLPDSLNSIGCRSFGMCTGLNEVVLPMEITQILSSTFWACSNLKEVKLPEKLEVIDFAAFEGCSALEDMIIPSSVKMLGYACFVGTELKSLQMSCQTVPEVIGEIFEEGDPLYETCQLIVPNSMIDLYRVHPVFGKFTNIFGMGISLDKSDLNLMVGDTALLKASVTLIETSDKSVTWSSSDKAVATVSKNGEVTAIAPGNTIITATASNGMIAICLVTVSAMEIEMKGIVLDAEVLDLEIGDTHQFVAMVFPEDTTYPELEWWIEDETIGVIDGNGFVTMMGEGSTTVHVRSVRWTHVEATCRLNVTSAVVGLMNNDAPCDIYSANGLLIKKAVPPSDIKDLDRGLYLIRRGNQIIKILK